MGTFRNYWKKVVSAYEKVYNKLSKTTVLATFCVCGKIKFFNENYLISPNQSGFKPEDSCINKLLCITRDIYKSFDCGYEVRGVFLDISKAFDKVWHDETIFKLEQNGISGTS